MKLLHITATSITKHDGISVVLKKIVKYQNEVPNAKSRVLSIKHKAKGIEIDFFTSENNFDKIKKIIIEYNPDIVIFHGFYFFDYIKVSNFLVKNKIKYYIQPHCSFMKAAQRKGMIKKYIANTFLLRKFVKRAQGNIFLNEEEKRNSKFMRVSDILIPNGIDMADDEVVKTEEDIIKIFYLGRIDMQHKGLDILCRELKKIDNKDARFTFDFYGTGNEKDIKKLLNAISKFNNLKVAYKGPVYDSQKEDVYKKYNIMILTSRYEGFPMTILEALSFGIPCIVSSGTNVRKMIENNNIGWGADGEEIPKVVINAIETYRMQRREYVLRTREFVRNSFNWRSIAKLSISEMKRTKKVSD